MRRVVLLWVMLAAACGGGGARTAAPAGDYLVAIEIEGTKAIPVEEIAPGLAIDRARGKRVVDPYQLSLDVERVRAAYLRLGFFDVTVTARIDTKIRKQTVVFTVVEGQRSTLRVEITGLPPDVPLERARALIASPDGAPFDYEVYDLAKEPMIKLLEDAGYANVEIDAAVLADKAKHVAVARFEIVPGERATFGPVTIEGAGLLEEAVRGRLELAEGEVYTQKAMAASQRAIYELNRFTSVRIEPDRSRGAIIPIKITVVRAPSGEWRYGGGVGIDPLVYEIRLRGGVGFVPDAFPLWSFGVDVRPSVTRARDVGEYQLGLRAAAFAQRMELFRPRMRGDVEVSYDLLRYEGYTTYGPRGRLGLASPLGVPWLQGRLGWVIEYPSYSNILVAEPVASEIGLGAPELLGAYEVSLLLDKRDNPIDVRKGFYVSTQATFGTPYAGGETTYQRLVPEGRFYIPIGPVVLAGRLRFGLLFGEVPVTARFFSGGATTQRGFSERRLSPYAATVDGGRVVIGGVGMIESGLEARFPLFTLGGFPFVGALFVDGADVVTDIDALSFADLHVAAGAGIYVKLFGLKVGFSLGQRVTRLDQSEPDGLWETIWENRAGHLSVGDTY